MPADLQTCFELAQAKSRYCRLMDTKDWTGVADLLTEDLVFDLGGGDDAPPIVGRDAALNAVQSSIVDAVTVHQVHSPEFDIDGDEARVVWAAQERVKWHNGAGLTAHGHYHERWVRRDGRWQIAELRLTHLLIDADRAQES
jgi:SnoaL-like domain